MSTENKYVSIEEFNALRSLLVQNTEYMSLLRKGLMKLSEQNLYLQKEIHKLKGGVKVTEKSDGDVYIDVSNSHVFESNEMYATKICKSVMNRTKCSFGTKCTFAHSIKQLRVRDCKFTNCVHVKPLSYSDNGYLYENVGDKVCEFWHQRESEISYAKRLLIPLDEKLQETDKTEDIYYHEYTSGCDCASCDGK
jgi:hypothetical protein